VLGLTARALTDATATCTDRPMGNGYVYRTCERSFGLLVATVIVAGIVNLVVWWRLIVRRQVMEGQTIGMNVMDLEVLTARDLTMIGTGQAFLRTILGGIMSFFLAIPAGVAAFLAVGGADSTGRGVEDVGWVAGGVVIFLFAFAFLPWLWNLVDRRRQTLYDKVAGTVVVRTR
jgi:uncharacterized RDD family membrane protein YckC